MEDGAKNTDEANDSQKGTIRDPIEEEINVLLIEDNPGDARLVKETLSEAKDCSFNLIWVNRLNAGLKVLKKANIDVVLSDLFLPDSRGFDTLRQIKAIKTHVPIIVMTGYDDDMGSIQATQNGAQDYIVKQGYHFKGVKRNKCKCDDKIQIDDQGENDLLVNAILKVIDKSAIKKRQKIKSPTSYNNKESKIQVGVEDTTHSKTPDDKESAQQGSGTAVTDLLQQYSQLFAAVKAGTVSEELMSDIENKLKDIHTSDSDGISEIIKKAQVQ